MIIGIDEAGRGAWAGPLVAAAVFLPEPLPGLIDSKLLRVNQRQQFAIVIKQTAVWGIGVVSAADIDQHGLSYAQTTAMQQALDSLNVTITDFQIIIDGSVNYLPNIPTATTLISADQTIPSVSAASIIAKVHRDSLMKDYAKIYPKYGFDQHVGYGTKAHHSALIRYGLCALHRRSYKPIAALA